jgi:gas vesicle protein
MSRHMQNGSAERLMALIGGLGAGIGLGLLLAPKSGRELRADLDRTACDGIAKIKHGAEELKTSAAGVIEKAKSAAQAQKEGVGQAIAAGKRAYLEASS